METPYITGMPQMPEDVRSVISLRGKFIPILDLRVRLAFSAATT